MKEISWLKKWRCLYTRSTVPLDNCAAAFPFMHELADFSSQKASSWNARGCKWNAISLRALQTDSKDCKFHSEVPRAGPILQRHWQNAMYEFAIQMMRKKKNAQMQWGFARKYSWRKSSKLFLFPIFHFSSGQEASLCPCVQERCSLKLSILRTKTLICSRKSLHVLQSILLTQTRSQESFWIHFQKSHAVIILGLFALGFHWNRVVLFLTLGEVLISEQWPAGSQLVAHVKIIQLLFHTIIGTWLQLTKRAFKPFCGSNSCLFGQSVSR